MESLSLINTISCVHNLDEAIVTITIHLFARAKDLAGTDHILIALSDGATVAELRHQLVRQVPALEMLIARSAVAVENEYANDDQIIKPGVEIALLPPVSGG
jgi:molybdopterin converting factor subunit 1